MAESKSAIYAAAVANLAIAAAKFTGSFLTGSTAMMAEGAHSVVDTTNQVLLLVGQKRSKKPATEKHPFGYGREIYFYAFVVALFIFLGGGIFALYEGAHKIRHPEPSQAADLFGWTVPGIWINVTILVFAILAEGASLFVAMRQFWAQKGDQAPFSALQRSKDPSLFTILVEDAAALIGLVIALVGVGLAHLLDMPTLDGWASIAIGLVLVGMSVFLMFETHGLLIGEAADPKVRRLIERIVREEKGVSRLNEVLTQHLGPKEILVNISVDIVDSMRGGEVEDLVGRLDGRLKEADATIRRVFIEIERHKHARRNPASAEAVATVT